ncbi:alpha/beta-hydrolase [Lophiostoma macrostomum CBS 122681]|uniref:Alpha/beta-hydrolase n=1 Tax=Lophiostoma macrostomum CBS 122681 TaxID=1314788 RepID=A0A6A6SW27_9PLEO|nr:alpha/beta-hydrolase [Lophiostoma macrostomum CBS 122681]
MATEPLDKLTTDLKDLGELPITSSKHSSLRVTHRAERSFYTVVVHVITRRFRNFMGRPKKQQPKGSIQLKPHKIILRTCTVSERRVEDIYVYDIKPRNIKGNDFDKRIYYFCGGGWQSPPSGQHWQLAAKLARQMPRTTISIVSYPLAPNNAAPVAFPMLMKLYRTLLQQSVDEGHRLVFAGDSSGANVVLSLVLEALREDETNATIASQPQTNHPVAIMLISPSTDLTRSNPDIERRAPFDPILTPDFVKSTAKAWCGDWDPTDRRVSPLNADIGLLAKRRIRCHGITGGYDILGPDAVLLRDRLEEESVGGEWLEWDKQMHCFVLTWPYGLHEAREGVGWMVDVLKKD